MTPKCSSLRCADPPRQPNAPLLAIKVPSAAYLSLIIHNFRCGLYVSLGFGSLYNGSVTPLMCTTCLATKRTSEGSRDSWRYRPPVFTDISSTAD